MECQRCTVCDLGWTVHQRPLVPAAAAAIVTHLVTHVLTASPAIPCLQSTPRLSEAVSDGRRLFAGAPQDRLCRDPLWSGLVLRLARRQQERCQANPGAFFQGCEPRGRGGCICCSSPPRISDSGGAARAHQCMCRLPVRLPIRLPGLIGHGGSVLKCCRGEEASKRRQPIERGPGTRTAGSGAPRSHLSRSNRCTGPGGGRRATRTTSERRYPAKAPRKKGTARVTSILRSTIARGLTSGRWSRQP